MKPAKALPPYLFKIHFNIILPPMTSSSKWSCPVMSPHQSPTSISCLPHICYISCLFMPTHPVSVNCTTTLTHISLCLFCLSPGIINTSSADIQIFHCTDAHIRHAAVFQLWHRKVNLEDWGLLVFDAVMTLQAVQKAFLHSWIPEDESFEMSQTIHSETQCYMPEHLNLP